MIAVHGSPHDRSAPASGRRDERPRVLDDRPPPPGGLALAEALIDRADFLAGGLVVDVGGGRGARVATLVRRGFVAVGVDRAAATLERARGRFEAGDVVLGEADALPFATASLDGLLAECALPPSGIDRRRVLAEWFRVLAPGGRLAIADLYRRAEAEAITLGVDLAPFATWRRIAADLDEAGFRVEWFEDRSEALGDVVARFVRDDGTLDPAWGGAGGVTVESLRAARPGYFLAVAERPRLGDRADRDGDASPARSGEREPPSSRPG